MASPEDIATRQAVYLERLKAGYVRSYASTHASLRERVRVVLQSLDISAMQDLSRRELEKVLFGLRASMMEIAAPALTEFLETKMPELANLWAALEVSTLAANIAGNPVFAAPTAKLAYQAALTSPVQATGELLAGFVGDWAASDAVRVSNVVRNGWAQSKTLQEMVREVVGTKKANYADGILDISRRHASTVIHTATQHTANAAKMKVWEDNSDIIKKYKWISTLDRRTTTQCKSLDGREFEAGKGPMPPIHPNCRSITIAVLPKGLEWLDEGATRASSGPTAGDAKADENYYDWLKRQPADFQDTALGNTRAKLFRDGGLTPDKFAELNLSRNFQPLTIAEMRDIMPDAFKRAGL
jgi:SPP1 gp7 family putative phage head morphogenesis protein